MPRLVLFALLTLPFFPGCSTPDVKSNVKGEASNESPSGTNAEENTPSEDDKSESSTEENGAENAMDLSRKAQALIKEGRYDEGYQMAGEAMKMFEKENNDLAWIMLESIEIGGKRIDVHFNMGERERNFPDDGIVRPLSFRVWSKGDEANLLEVVDFEIGRMDGESLTAAIGEMTNDGHINHGIMQIDSDYETIRKRIIEHVSSE